MLETKNPSMSISTNAPTSSNSPTYSFQPSPDPTTVLTPEPTPEQSKSSPLPSPRPSPDPAPGPTPDPTMETPEPPPDPSSPPPSPEPTIQTTSSGTKPTPDPSSTSPAPSPASTADSGLLGCETSYVHCGDEISTCFINFLGGGTRGGGPWGWSVDLLNVNLSENDLVCAVYAGAGQCDFTKDDAILVGDFVISETAVEWRFGNGIGASDVHFYAGKCKYNDGGDHLENADNSCQESAMRQNARVNGKYTLTKDPLDPLATEFVFDILDNNSTELRKQAWLRQNYSVFPLGGSERRYFSAHATVCPTASTSSIEKIADDVDQNTPAAIASASGALITGSVFAALGVALAVGLAAYYMYGGKKSGGSVSEESSTSSDSVAY